MLLCAKWLSIQSSLRSLEWSVPWLQPMSLYSPPVCILLYRVSWIFRIKKGDLFTFLSLSSPPPPFPPHKSPSPLFHPCITLCSNCTHAGSNVQSIWDYSSAEHAGCHGNGAGWTPLLHILTWKHWGTCTYTAHMFMHMHVPYHKISAHSHPNWCHNQYNVGKAVNIANYLLFQS